MACCASRPTSCVPLCGQCKVRYPEVRTTLPAPQSTSHSELQPLSHTPRYTATAGRSAARARHRHTALTSSCPPAPSWPRCVPAAVQRHPASGSAPPAVCPGSRAGRSPSAHWSARPAARQSRQAAVREAGGRGRGGSGRWAVSRRAQGAPQLEYGPAAHPASRSWTGPALQ